jgi:hypothetical protein
MQIKTRNDLKDFQISRSIKPMDKWHDSGKIFMILEKYFLYT